MLVREIVAIVVVCGSYCWRIRIFWTLLSAASDRFLCRSWLHEKGVYGYGYIESGKAVMQLFANRGWEAIIADDLVGGAIFLICVMIGLIVGGIGVGYAQLDPNYENLTQNSILFAFLVGFIAGLIISAVLLSTISSGVNTVIVMFADAPQEFQTNHPELSAKMRATWQEFYPSSIQ